VYYQRGSQFCFMHDDHLSTYIYIYIYIYTYTHIPSSFNLYIQDDTDHIQ